MKEIEAKDLAARLDAGEAFYLLDVRQPWEHQLAALPGSKLIPLNQLAGRSGEIACPPGVPLVVYCHHGIRSQIAATALEGQGFSDVYNLVGGIDAWSTLVDVRVPRY